jgi:glycerol-3-phosphate acyltransferase PlsY
MNVLLTIVIAYLIGSFPTAYLAGRLLKGVDIRTIGSGNVGATNVMRVLGTGWGVTTLVIDLIKGYVTVAFVAPLICPDAASLPMHRIIACVAVIAGHNWMIFLGFKGGKGAATTAGAFLALAPLVGLLSFGLWGVIVAVTRYVSLGSIIAGIALPLLMLAFRQPPLYLYFSIVITVVLVYAHRHNISRLLSGTERKLKGSGKGAV